MFGKRGKMRKLICVDIDGTVLDHNGYINPRVFDEFKTSQHQMIIASGRPLNEIRKFGFNGDCVGSNGAEIVKDGKLIQRLTLKPEVVKELYTFFTENFGNITVSTEKGRFLNSCIDLDKVVGEMVVAFNGEFTQAAFDKIKGEYKQCTGYISDIDQFLSDGHQISKLECSTMAMTELLLTKYGQHPDLSVFTSIGGFIEVVPPSVNKAESIKKYIGDEEYQIFAIGDGNNDIEMFELADVSFAMGNGTENLKAVATHHTASISEDGFLKAVAEIEARY